MFFLLGTGTWKEDHFFKCRLPMCHCLAGFMVLVSLNYMCTLYFQYDCICRAITDYDQFFLPHRINIGTIFHKPQILSTLLQSSKSEENKLYVTCFCLTNKLTWDMATHFCCFSWFWLDLIWFHCCRCCVPSFEGLSLYVKPCIWIKLKLVLI